MLSCRTGALRGGGHFVTLIGLRLVLQTVANRIPCRPTGGPRKAVIGVGTPAPRAVGASGRTVLQFLNRS